MTTAHSTRTAFEHSLFDVLRTAFRITRNDPRFALRALRLMRRQQEAARNRAAQERSGTHVPPFVIYSVTERCNLACDGCYANILHRTDKPELEDARIRGLLHEARSLGVSVMLLAGGEPLIRPGLLELTATTPEILFLLFTNGSLLDETRLRALRTQPHVIPVLSLEGDQDLTDARRGRGTHQTVLETMARLKANRTFFGTSTTLTRENFDLATSEEHLRDLLARGCRLFYFINYVPVKEGTEDLQLTHDQVEELERRLTSLRHRVPALFIAFPHDEMALGGCLAAGRGFIHINAAGDAEPCPFSPYSDSNLSEVSLKKALHSPLFAKILNSEIALDESDGRCALWKQRKWVATLLKEELLSRTVPVLGTDDNDTEQGAEAGMASAGHSATESRASQRPILGTDDNDAEQGAEAGTASAGHSATESRASQRPVLGAEEDDAERSPGERR